MLGNPRKMAYSTWSVSCPHPEVKSSKIRIRFVFNINITVVFLFYYLII